MYKIDDKKSKRLFINELKELIEILRAGETLNTDSLQMEFPHQKLIEIGIITNKDELEGLYKLLVDVLNVTVEEFMNLINLVYHDNTKTCHVHKFCNYCRENMKNIEEKDDKPVIVDLFCGAGGMSLGFKQAGFKIAFANDIDPACVETYSFNHPELHERYIYHEDINNIIEEIDTRIRYKKVDVVIGGPPCQGFSNANRQRLIDDPRNKLYKSFVKVVEKLQPKFFVMENVRGMLSVATQVMEDFESIGYKLDYEVLNSIEFGVPQNRNRIIFIGNRIGIENSSIFNEIHLKNSFHNRRYSLGDAIGDLPSLNALRIRNATDLDTEESGKKIDKNLSITSNEFLHLINEDTSTNVLYNHKARYNNERDIEIFGRLHQGDNSNDPKIADIMPYHSRNDIFKDKYYKLIYDEPCKTITAHMKFDCNMYIHPTQARGLTPREAARVQTFPDDYFFKGPYTKTYMQIGNAVPPLMSRGISEAVLNAMKEVNLNNVPDQLNV
ncbi:DNA cytosine methyltransferase [Sporosarcina psychrophila]|uniref:DNA cytosine methyltransferase n=1 Tax=Sporosarcina psychrophila TaxID=1476 RepID=UPI0030D473C6